MRIFLWLVISFIPASVFAQQIESFINAREARRIIGVLASDSLGGRANFSHDIRKAARFISGEFTQSGLQPFYSDDTLMQSFIALEKHESLEQVILNGRKLKEKDYFYTAPFRFPPALRAGDFVQKRYSRAFSIDELKDSLQAWRTIPLPLLVTVQESKRLMKQLNDEPVAKQSNVRLVLEEEGPVESLELFLKPALLKKMLFNVIGQLPGRSKPDEIVLVTAHYDHVGVKSGRVFNGANDNASGTASMMMLANYFAARKNNERTLVFVAFAGEEIGLLGSMFFANQLSGKKIVAVINLEMLGKTPSHDKRYCIVTGGGPVAVQIRNSAAEHGIEIRTDVFVHQNLFARSDNYPFAMRGIPAHTFMIWIEQDPNYHQPSDDIETLDLENMSEIVKALAAGIEKLANGGFTLGN